MPEPILFNFRIPVDLKQLFEKSCSLKNVSMTSQLNILINDFVISETKIRQQVTQGQDEPLRFFMSYDEMEG
jgi:hypothetical protein